MEEIDTIFREAVADGRIHGAVLLAKDLTGAYFRPLITSELVINPQCRYR